MQGYRYFQCSVSSKTALPVHLWNRSRRNWRRRGESTLRTSGKLFWVQKRTFTTDDRPEAFKFIAKFRARWTMQLHARQVTLRVAVRVSARVSRALSLRTARAKSLCKLRSKWIYKFTVKSSPNSLAS